MCVLTSEVGYTIATTRRETTKVYKNMWWHWEEKKSNKQGLGRKTLCKVKISIEILILCDVSHIVRDVITYRSAEHCICKYGEEVLKMETAEYNETLTPKC